jgi:hypothetical protein
VGDFCHPIDNISIKLDVAIASEGLQIDFDLILNPS